MKLDCKDVLRRHRAGKRKRVVREPRDHIGHGRLYKIAVDKVEALAFLDPLAATAAAALGFA